MSEKKRKASEIIEAVEDRLAWKEHVRKRKQAIQHNPDLYYSWETAVSSAKKLLNDFSDEPEDSVITIFSTQPGEFKIDAISNYPEFELHRSEYEPEDVLALVYFKEGEPFVKRMKS
jgi:hypothetical protein